MSEYRPFSLTLAFFFLGTAAVTALLLSTPVGAALLVFGAWTISLEAFLNVMVYFLIGAAGPLMALFMVRDMKRDFVQTLLKMLAAWFGFLVATAIAFEIAQEAF